MFKLLFCLNILLIFIILSAAKSIKRNSLDDNTVKDEASWQNLWFPLPPNYQNDVKPQAINVVADKLREENSSYNTKSSDWASLWFPHPPNYQSDKTVEDTSIKFSDIVKERECDDGRNDLSVDFDPHDKRHSFNYLCIGNKNDYTPNLNTSAVLKVDFIPFAYKPPVKCLNESIEYTESIPTFGAYRPLAPKFGSYQFLPPQRWLHSLAEGAIVLLYHPCSFPAQLENLQNTLKSCLYRHIITPSQLLTPQHPFALLAWGKILHMSVVDDDIVVKFIKDNAKTGSRGKHQNLEETKKLYDAGLMIEAHLVTDEQDVEICGYKEMK